MIKDLPILERPREKALRYGVDSLSNVELLAIIVSSGTRGNSAFDIAHKLFMNLGGMYRLSISSLSDLQSVPGINQVSALKLQAVFEFSRRLRVVEQEVEENEVSSRYIFEKYRPRMEGLEQEIFGVVSLNNKHQILNEKIVYRGTKSRIEASTKEVLKELIRVDAKNFYIFHNHPSNDPVPSDEDTIFTIELIKQAKKIGIKMLDHIIICRNEYYSFLKNGKLLLNKEEITSNTLDNFREFTK